MKQAVLMKQMLRLLDQQWVTEGDFDKLLEAMSISRLEARIFTMTKVVGLVRMIPEEIFPNIETKQNMMSSASDLLDSLVEQENEDEVQIIEDDADFGVLGDISIPGVMDRGEVTSADNKIPDLALSARSPDKK